MLWIEQRNIQNEEKATERSRQLVNWRLPFTFNFFRPFSSDFFAPLVVEQNFLNV